LAQTYAEVFQHLMEAHRIITASAILLTPTLRAVGYSTWKEGVSARLYAGERRARITANDAWESRMDLLRRISDISSLSVQQVRCLCARCVSSYVE
jgi:hypothetical protein